MNWYIFSVCSFFPNSINSSIRLNSEKTDVAITTTSVSTVNIIAWLTPSFDIFSQWRRALQSPFSWLLGNSVAGSVPSEEYAVWNEFEIGLMHFEISWIKEALFWLPQKMYRIFLAWLRYLSLFSLSHHHVSDVWSFLAILKVNVPNHIKTIHMD